jgi:NitT/TauT family transport system substrate-binding protein
MTIIFGLALAFASPAAAEKIKLSYAGVNANFAQYFAAEDKGYFKEEGLDVELVQAGGGVATPGLIAGSLTYSGSPSSAMSAILKGAQLKVILIGQSKPIYELWSFDPAVTRFEELRGKAIAISARGGTDELVIRMYLNEKKLPANYVALTPMGSAATRTAAILAGTQSHAILTRTEKGEVRRAGLIDKGRMIVDFHDEVELQTGGIVTTDKELAENRDRAKRVLRAVWKGTIFLMTDREGVLALMRKRLPTMQDDILVPDVEGGMKDVDDDGVMSIETAAKELAVRGEINNVSPDKIPPPEKVYDFSLIREVTAELKGWKPAQ